MYEAQIEQKHAEEPVRTAGGPVTEHQESGYDALDEYSFSEEDAAELHREVQDVLAGVDERAIDMTVVSGENEYDFGTFPGDGVADYATFFAEDAILSSPRITSDGDTYRIEVNLDWYAHERIAGGHVEPEPLGVSSTMYMTVPRDALNSEEQTALSTLAAEALEPARPNIWVESIPLFGARLGQKSGTEELPEKATKSVDVANTAVEYHSEWAEDIAEAEEEIRDRQILREDTRRAIEGFLEESDDAAEEHEDSDGFDIGELFPGEDESAAPTDTLVGHSTGVGPALDWLYDK